VRRSFLLAPLLCCVLPFSSSAQPPVRERIAAYFRAWYAHIPGSEVSVSPTREVVLPGFEAYKVERRSSSKSHQEENIAFYDAGRDEVFVGDLLHDPGRSTGNRPFDPGRDLPNIEASMAELFGLPVKVELGSTARGAGGPLLPLTISVRQDKDSDSFAARAGFVSKDGSTLMLGEFQPLAGGPAAFREKLLGQTEGVRPRQGSPTRQSRSGDGARFTVTEFLDFQCDRCRVRTPDVRRAVEEKGGTVEVRFLPLVKTHDWAFAAAESAAALAGVKPELYRRYEEAVFARSEGMSRAAARELASDIAEAAGARDAFAAELSSGRARARVLRDVDLAMRLGVMVTPAFLYRGTLLPGEKGFLETFLRESLTAPAQRTATPTE
jgi:2-hydroxychromene-2-carboxylate isomerase